MLLSKSNCLFFYQFTESVTNFFRKCITFVDILVMIFGNDAALFLPIPEIKHHFLFRIKEKYLSENGINGDIWSQFVKRNG